MRKRHEWLLAEWVQAVSGSAGHVRTTFLTLEYSQWEDWVWRVQCKWLDVCIDGRNTSTLLNDTADWARNRTFFFLSRCPSGKYTNCMSTYGARRTQSKKKREGSTQAITEFSRDRNSAWWRMQDWQDSSLLDKDRASVCIVDHSTKTVVVVWLRQLHSEALVLHVPLPGSSASLGIRLVLPKLRNWFDRFLNEIRFSG